MASYASFLWDAEEEEEEEEEEEDVEEEDSSSPIPALTSLVPMALLVTS
jgi:CO dehydrogenase/acetyl-CoA synthase beta subunit